MVDFSSVQSYRRIEAARARKKKDKAIKLVHEKDRCLMDVGSSLLNFSALLVAQLALRAYLKCMSVRGCDVLS